MADVAALYGHGRRDDVTALVRNRALRALAHRFPPLAAACRAVAEEHETTAAPPADRRVRPPAPPRRFRLARPLRAGDGLPPLPAPSLPPVRKRDPLAARVPGNPTAVPPGRPLFGQIPCNTMHRPPRLPRIRWRRRTPTLCRCSRSCRGGPPAGPRRRLLHWLARELCDDEAGRPALGRHHGGRRGLRRQHRRPSALQRRVACAAFANCDPKKFVEQPEVFVLEFQLGVVRLLVNAGPEQTGDLARLRLRLGDG